ncbi:MAG TPA: heavy-metal-associated domain-containing protein [Methylotenera sp.]|jgi:copper chaperone CopZ
MQTEHIIVTGMTCGGCVNSLTRALKAVAGVGDVNVTLATGETSVQYDENLTATEQLRSAVENAGYGIK